MYKYYINIYCMNIYKYYINILYIYMYTCNIYIYVQGWTLN